jgi:hypothetical protein
MKRLLTFCLYFVLAAVVLSEIRTVWIAITARNRFTQVFPSAVGFMYYIAVVTSASAGVNAIAVWLRHKWAVWANVVIGAWSILLVGILGGPRASQVVIFFATASVLVFALLLPERFNSQGVPQGAPHGARTKRQEIDCKMPSTSRSGPQVLRKER